MFCIYCNHVLAGGEKVCPSCGKPVGMPVRIEVFRDGEGLRKEADSLSELALPEQGPIKPEQPEPDPSGQRISEQKAPEQKAPEQVQEEEKTLSDKARESTGGKTSVRESSRKSGVIPAVTAAVVSIIVMVCVAAGLNGRIRRTENAAKEAAQALFDAQDTEISELEGKTGELEEKIHSLEDLLESQNETISSLTEELNALRETNRRLEDRLEELENSVADDKTPDQKENIEESPAEKE